MTTTSDSAASPGEDPDERPGSGTTTGSGTGTGPSTSTSASTNTNTSTGTGSDSNTGSGSDNGNGASGNGIGRGALLLMTVATGLSCASNYFAQPLLDLISRDLHLSAGLAGLIVTASQAGYALGLMLLVPLGDVRDRRRLAVGLFLASAAFLAVTAASAGGPMMLVGTVLVALTSVGAQVIVPYAASLAPEAERGRIVGIVMSGILLGGLLARTASGLLSTLGGWRTIYVVNAVLMAGMALLLARFLPRAQRSPAPNGDGQSSGRSVDEGPVMGYPALLRSTLALLRDEPVLRRRATLAAFSIASYSVQLTALTFLLAGEPFRWSEASIGLFGLVGVVGVVTMTCAGKLNDRGYVQHVTAGGVLLLTGSWLVLLAGERSLVWLVVGVVGLNVAQQAVLNSSQKVVYALRPEARNRINSAFMTTFFVGGAVGSALTSVVRSVGGWSGICLLGAGLGAGAVLLWATERLRGRSWGRGGKGGPEGRGDRRDSRGRPVATAGPR
ncbi:MFS transporter [Streptomyces sp. NPDC048172]|uniref:MFS transporter n=1 Tax=Streptomyces sp. NPDC048172 TaxID=3365505 RepID=UPI00371ECDE3